MAGQVWLEPKTMQTLISAAAHRENANRDQSLNSRERAVLKLVFEDLTNKEIAARLQTTEGSIKAVMQQLFDKTGVRARSQLVRIAIEKHLQDWPDSIDEQA